jgi:hypothetical protein
MEGCICKNTALFVCFNFWTFLKKYTCNRSLYYLALLCKHNN